MNTEKGFFEYECKFYDDYEKKMENVKGVVYADTLTKAMTELELYYGAIEDVKLKQFNAPCDVYEFKEGSVNFHLTVDENGEAVE